MAEGSWSATKKFVHDRAGGFCEYCQTLTMGSSWFASGG
jgi:hypothetical protein